MPLVLIQNGDVSTTGSFTERGNLSPPTPTGSGYVQPPYSNPLDLEDATQGYVNNAIAQQAAFTAANYVTPSGLLYTLANQFAYNVPLSGSIDGQNLIFGTPNAFVPATITVYYNGQALVPGSAGDFIVASSGNTLVYDSIRLLHTEGPPFGRDVLTATYLIAQN